MCVVFVLVCVCVVYVCACTCCACVVCECVRCVCARAVCVHVLCVFMWWVRVCAHSMGLWLPGEGRETEREGEQRRQDRNEGFQPRNEVNARSPGAGAQLGPGCASSEQAVFGAASWLPWRVRSAHGLQPASV